MPSGIEHVGGLPCDPEGSFRRTVVVDEFEVPHTQHLDRLAYVPTGRRSVPPSCFHQQRSQSIPLHFLSEVPARLFARKRHLVCCDDHPRDPSAPLWHISEVQMFHSSGKREFSVILSRDSIRHGNYVHHFGWPFLEDLQSAH